MKQSDFLAAVHGQTNGGKNLKVRNGDVMDSKTGEIYWSPDEKSYNQGFHDAKKVIKAIQKSGHNVKWKENPDGNLRRA